MIVAVLEELDMLTTLIVSLAVVGLERGFLACPVHPLDLPVGPGMTGFGNDAWRPKRPILYENL